MRKEFLPFTRPAITESDIQAVTEVLRSGWLTNGPVSYTHLTLPTTLTV